MKVTNPWDGSIVELLTFRSVSELNLIALPQSDVPQVTIRIGNRPKAVFDLISGLVMMMRYR